VAIGSAFVFGCVIAIAALLLATVLDRTVSAPEDLTSLPGVSLVVVVPPQRRRKRTTTARRSKRRRRAQTDATLSEGPADADGFSMEGAST
jgi:hypothetical protein